MSFTPHFPQLLAKAACLGIVMATFVQADTDSALRVQPEQCIDAVLAQDPAPFDAYDAALAMDRERDGLPDIRRVIEPDVGAEMLMFAVSPLYYDTATEVGADCQITVTVETGTVPESFAAFRADLATRFGPFEPYTTDEAVWDEVACVAARPLRLILRERGAAGGMSELTLSIWNSTREGTSC